MLCDSLQTIYQDKNEGSSSRRADTIYTREINEYMKGEYIGRFRRRFTGI